VPAAAGDLDQHGRKQKPDGKRASSRPTRAPRRRPPLSRRIVSGHRRPIDNCPVARPGAYSPRIARRGAFTLYSPTREMAEVIE
jgi:hypothetical protein